MNQMAKQAQTLLLAVFVMLSINLAVVPVSAEAATYAATLRIVSYGPGGLNGHAFVIVDNLGSVNRKVGLLTVSGRDQVSVGTWGNKSSGKGVYYNQERYGGTGRYPGRVSLSMQLTSSQLSTVSSIIKNNNKWTATTNCSSFAVKVWNSVSSTKLSAGLINTPTNLKNSIKSKAGYGTNTYFTSVGSTRVYRQVGSTGIIQGSVTGSFSSSSS